MEHQQDRTMAARYLPFREESTLTLANKTGSLDEVKNDVGIVVCGRGSYVYAIFCDRSRQEGETVDNTATVAVAKVSRLLFDFFLPP
jgi:beta-lactamase class A